MALKGDRFIPLDGTRWDIYMDEVAERGGIISYASVGSGRAYDQAANLGTYAANPSGKVPIGVILEDMVDVDLTRYKLNQHRSEVQKGQKISVATKGMLVTNRVEGSVTTAGPAYLGHSGLFTATSAGTTQNPLVGRFDSTPDPDGFVKVYINLP